jgi:lipopolysaccharide cholinephosphotransferase
MTVIPDLADATPEEMRALQLKELEILKYLRQVCEENHLLFYLAGGSAIGALRHQGFVPWDDDVDVFMPRKDYETLYSKWNQISSKKQYQLCRSDDTHNYRHGAMTLNDSQTTFINFRTADQDVNQGIAIDILPMDLMAETSFRRAKQRFCAILFSIYINQRLPDNQGKVLRALTGLPLALIHSPKARIRVWKWAEKHMTKPSYGRSQTSVELVTGLKAMLRPLPSQWFKSTKLVPFEDTQMPVAEGVEDYLHLIFGDYMQLPPKDQQKAKHHTALIDTETSYTNYRGKYYLVKE